MVMDKYLIKRLKKWTSELSSVGNKSISNKTPSSSSLEFNPKELISDPGLRPPITSYNVNERDKIRRVYISKRPCQGNLWLR